MLNRRRVIPFLIAILTWLPGSAATEAQRLRTSIDGQVRPAKVQEELVEVDAKLRAGKWKAGLKDAQLLTEVVLARTWYGKELRGIISELALYQAVAEANLGKNDRAIWHWHIALNLDRKIRRRDLAPYGKAAKLLYEFPLRAEGEVPAPYVVPETYPGGPLFVGPVRPKMSSVPTVLNNTGAAIEGSGDFQVELIIDRRGRIQQPVVISDHLHPIVIYASLEWLRKMPVYEPARFEGEPADYLDLVTIRFHVSRW